MKEKTEEQKQEEQEAAMAILGCFGAFMFIPVTIGLRTILNALVLSQLWGWFIVTSFDVSPLSLAGAAGVALVMSMLTHQSQSYKDTKQADWTSLAVDTVTSILSPLVYLFMGWIIYLLGF